MRIKKSKKQTEKSKSYNLRLTLRRVAYGVDFEHHAGTSIVLMQLILKTYKPSFEPSN